MEASGHVGYGGKVFGLHVGHMERRGQIHTTVIISHRERATVEHCLVPDEETPNNNKR